MRFEQNIDLAVVAGDDGNDIAGELKMVGDILAAAGIAVDHQIGLLEGPGIGDRGQERIEGLTGAIGDDQQPVVAVEVAEQLIF